MKRLLWVFAFILFVSAWAGYSATVHASGDHEGGHDEPAGPSGGTLHAVGVKLGMQFTFEPVNPPLKNHIWMKTDTNKVSFFHFAKPVSAKKNKLLFMGDAIKGRFCAEDQPDGGKTGFVHFHSAKVAPGHKHGHGGEKGAEGYWLRHIALGDFKMMGIHFTPGIAHNFKATKAPSCS